MKLIIPREIYSKMRFWVDKASGEVSGLGRYSILGENAKLEHLYLLEQSNSGAETTLDATAIAKLMYQTKDDSGLLNFWWHSHASMAVFWSGTDDATIKQIGKEGACLALVINKKNEMKCRLYCRGNSFAPDMDVDNLSVEVDDGVSAETKLRWEEEYKAKCKDIIPDYNGYIRQGLPGNFADDYDPYRSDHYYTSPKDYGEDKINAQAVKHIQDSLLTQNKVQTYPTTSQLKRWGKADWEDEFILWYGHNPKDKKELETFKQTFTKDVVRQQRNKR